MTLADPRRYHLALTSAGRPVMHGWWAVRTTAEGCVNLTALSHFRW
jgi:hypothetical protein